LIRNWDNHIHWDRWCINDFRDNDNRVDGHWLSDDWVDGQWFHDDGIDDHGLNENRVDDYRLSDDWVDGHWLDNNGIDDNRFGCVDFLSKSRG
jgi:hypothetical protein